MQYILLINTDETAEAARSAEENEAIMSGYYAFTKELRESGAFVGGDELQPTSTATTVRVRDGKTMITDGPYAETKEQLGGYYLIEAANLDEAITWAAKIPGANHGAIEVRPISVYE